MKAIVAGLGLATGAAISATALWHSAVACRPADSRSAATVSTLQSLASSSVPADVQLRDSLGISIRRASDVSLITKETTCQRGVTELNKLWQTPTAQRQVFVYKVGSDFGVEDPQAGSGDYRGVAFFSSKWVYKSLLVAP